MRVTNRLMYSALVRDINVSSEKMLDLNKQISSAKRISKPSDDPIGMSNILTYRTDLYAYEQYSTNITMADGWISRTDTVLMNTDDLLARATEIATQSASSTATDSTRAGAAEEVAELLEELVGLANSKYGSKYMFAGTSTQDAAFLDIDVDLLAGEITTISATAPTTPATGDAYISTTDNHIYEFDGTTWVDQGAPATGTVVQVADQDGDIYIYDAENDVWQTQYQGNADTFSAKIGTTDSIVVNITGDETFSSSMKALLQLYTALSENDQTGISEQLTTIENASVNINNKLSIVGARENRLAQAESVLNDAIVDSEERLSDIEDLDYAKAVTELENQQIIYQATLQSASLITELSLVDYI